jgi:hypothetical protein
MRPVAFGSGFKCQVLSRLRILRSTPSHCGTKPWEAIFPVRKGCTILKRCPGSHELTKIPPHPFLRVPQRRGRSLYPCPCHASIQFTTATTLWRRRPVTFSPTRFFGGGARINERHQPSHCISCTLLKDATKARFRVAHVGDVIGAELHGPACGSVRWHRGRQ